MDRVSAQAEKLAPAEPDTVAPTLDWYKLAHGLCDERDDLLIMEWDGDTPGGWASDDAALVAIKLNGTARNGRWSR